MPLSLPKGTRIETLSHMSQMKIKVLNDSSSPQDLSIDRPIVTGHG